MGPRGESGPQAACMSLLCQRQQAPRLRPAHVILYCQPRSKRLVVMEGGQGRPAAATPAGACASPPDTAGSRQASRREEHRHRAARCKHKQLLWQRSPAMLDAPAGTKSRAGPGVWAWRSRWSQGVMQEPSQLVIVTLVLGENRSRWVSCRGGGAGGCPGR